MEFQKVKKIKTLPVLFWFGLVWFSEGKHGVAVNYLMEWEQAGNNVINPVPGMAVAFRRIC